MVWESLWIDFADEKIFETFQQLNKGLFGQG